MNLEIISNIKIENLWYNEFLIERIKKADFKTIRKLDIWDKNFIDENNIIDPRNFLDKVIHFYLKLTHRSPNFIVKLIDKTLTYIYK